MRLTYVIDDLRVAGAQIHLTRLLGALEKIEDWELEVACLGPAAPAILARLPAGVRVRSFAMGSVKNPRFLPAFLSLVLHLRRSRPDIVHTYLNTAGVFGLLAARLAGVRRVAASRRDMGVFRSPRIAALEAWLSRGWADLVFCVCEAVAREARERERIPEDKLRVVRNGVDTAAIAPLARYDLVPPPRFCVVASLNRPQKGVADFLEAAAATLRSGLSLEFSVVGGGPLEEGLRAQAQRLGLTGPLRFLGEQADVGQVLQDHHVLVVPSHTEGISNAVLEAMAVGLPTIATSVDGNFEVVVPGQTGALVPPRDPEALAAAMLTYARHPDLVEKHGRAARRRAEAEFDLALMARRYGAEYRGLVERIPGP